MASLLREIQPTARLAEFAEFPPGHYTLRVEVPGEIGKTLILARRLIEDATTRPPALRSLRFVLRSEVLRQHSHRAVSGARAVRAEVDRTVIGTCPMCGHPATPGERVVVRRAQVIHARCWRPDTPGGAPPAGT